jgi:hypothetical protein
MLKISFDGRANLAAPHGIMSECGVRNAKPVVRDIACVDEIPGATDYVLTFV